MVSEEKADVLKGKPIIGTFTERSYWWMWIPIIGWLPFFFPLILPLGPIGLLGSRAKLIRFLQESYIHNGEVVPSSLVESVTGTYTLGYETVFRAYRLLKKMRKQCGFQEEQGPIQWNPLWLLIYPLCSALVLMPLVKAMCQHWQRHIEQGSFSLWAIGDGQNFAVQLSSSGIRVISDDGKVINVNMSAIPAERPVGFQAPDFTIQKGGKKFSLCLRGTHRDIFWRLIGSLR